VSGEELRHVPDPQDVRVPVLLGEAEALGEVLARLVAVEDLGLHPPGLQLVVEHLGDRGLPGSRQAGEPHGEPPLLRTLRQRKLLPTAPSGVSMPNRSMIVGPTSTRRRPSTRPVGWPGRPAMTKIPARSWLAPSGPVSFSCVNTSGLPTVPTERHRRSPKYTMRSGATPRTSG